MRKNNKLIKEIKKVNKNIVKDAKYVALKIKSLESLEKRYLIVSDLDGTLLRSDNTISKFSELIIKKLVRKGHIFCLSTGRPLRAAVQYYKQLGLNSLLLNFNGSYISNPSDKMFIPLNLGFSNEILRKIFFNKKILQWAKNILVENTEGDFIWKKPETANESASLWAHFHLSSDAKHKYIAKDLSNIRTDVHSILIDLKDDKYINLLAYEIKSITATLIVRNWSIPGLGTVIEINSIFSSKGTTLKYLSSYYGIPLERCMSFGDGDNDAEMLRTSYHSFAMQNATTTAKLSASKMTKYSNNDDGVARQLKLFFKL